MVLGKNEDNSLASKNHVELEQILQFLGFLVAIEAAKPGDKTQGIDNLELYTAAAIQYIGTHLRRQSADLTRLISQKNFVDAYDMAFGATRLGITPNAEKFKEERNLIIAVMFEREHPALSPKSTPKKEAIQHTPDTGLSNEEKFLLAVCFFLGAGLIGAAWGVEDFADKRLDFGADWGVTVAHALTFAGSFVLIGVLVAIVMYSRSNPSKKPQEIVVEKIAADIVQDAVQNREGHKAKLLAQVQTTVQTYTNTALQQLQQAKTENEATENQLITKIDRLETRSSSFDFDAQAALREVEKLRLNFLVKIAGLQAYTLNDNTEIALAITWFEKEGGKPDQLVQSVQGLWKKILTRQANTQSTDLPQAISEKISMGNRWGVVEQARAELQLAQETKQSALLEAIIPLVETHVRNFKTLNRKNIEAIYSQLESVLNLPKLLSWVIDENGQLIVKPAAQLSGNADLDAKVVALIQGVLRASLSADADTTRGMSDAFLDRFCEKFDVQHFGHAQRQLLRAEATCISDIDTMLSALTRRLKTAIVQKIMNDLHAYGYQNIQFEMDEHGNLHVSNLDFSADRAPFNPLLEKAAKKYIAAVLNDYMSKHPGQSEYVAEAYMQGFVGDAHDDSESAASFISPDDYQTLKKQHDRIVLKKELDNFTEFTGTSFYTASNVKRLFDNYQHYFPTEVNFQRDNGNIVTVTQIRTPEGNNDDLNNALHTFIGEVLTRSLNNKLKLEADTRQAFCEKLGIAQTFWHNTQERKLAEDRLLAQISEVLPVSVAGFTRHRVTAENSVAILEAIKYFGCKDVQLQLDDHGDIEVASLQMSEKALSSAIEKNIKLFIAAVINRYMHESSKASEHGLNEAYMSTVYFTENSELAIDRASHVRLVTDSATFKIANAFNGKLPWPTVNGGTVVPVQNMLKIYPSRAITFKLAENATLSEFSVTYRQDEQCVDQKLLSEIEKFVKVVLEFSLKASDKEWQSADMVSIGDFCKDLGVDDACFRAWNTKREQIAQERIELADLKSFNGKWPNVIDDESLSYMMRVLPKYIKMIHLNQDDEVMSVELSDDSIVLTDHKKEFEKNLKTLVTTVLKTPHGGEKQNVSGMRSLWTAAYNKATKAEKTCLTDQGIENFRQAMKLQGIEARPIADATSSDDASPAHAAHKKRVVDIG